MRSRLSADPGTAVLLPLVAALGCATGGDAGLDLLRYQRALGTASQDPAAGWDACATVADPGLRGDCRMAVVEAWAGAKSASTSDLLARCASLEATWMAQECAFQIGERRSDPSACAQAGAFADDCRLHLATRGFDAWMPRDARVDDPALHARMIREAEAATLSADDLRVWSAFFRRVLAQQPTLDRRPCRTLPPPLDDACWRTGGEHYHDRLNMARDQGLYPCQGGDLPGFLRTVEDPELDALRQAREPGDLCPAQGAP